jgi:cardiolipin synthase
VTVASTRVKVWASLNWPNRISLVRLLMVVPFIVLLQHHQQWSPARYATLGIFVAMAISDIVDGVLARRMGARTRLGAILDPLADKVLVICAVVLLSLPYTAVKAATVPDWVVVFVVGKDLWVIIGFVVIYLVTDRFRIRPTLAGKACTIAQAAMISLVLLAPDLNRLSGELDVGTRAAQGVFYVVVALCLAAGVSYTRLGLSFVLAEQKPMDANRGSNQDTEKRNNGSD